MRYLRSAVTGAVLLAAVGCTGSPTAVGGSGTAGSSIGPAAAPPASIAAPATAPAWSSASLTTDTGASIAPTATPPPRTTSSGATASPRITASPRTITPPRATASPRTTAGPVTLPTADLRAPGPDDGPPCAVDPQYSDEAPTGLRPDVLTAWVAVKKYAKKQGVALCLNDGKRSTAQQLALYDDYVKEFGKAAADVYVLPPAKSAHVKGYAVDVQPAAAYQWLQATKGDRGWCRIYDNEPWHFEYSRAYPAAGCPARQPKPVR